MRVNYSEENGDIQIREVPDKADPKSYKYGVVIGPPDLSDLSLSSKLIKQLSRELALAGFGNYKDTMSRRGELLDVVRKVTGNKDKTLLKQILYIYQKNYFED
jgi:hypothetical protein